MHYVFSFLLSPMSTVTLCPVSRSRKSSASITGAISVPRGGPPGGPGALV